MTITAKEQVEAAQRERTKLARELGKAQGKLEASEWPGVVDGWKRRAEQAESERDAALERVEELLEAIASAQTSLATGPAKDGYAYSVLDEAANRARAALDTDEGEG